MWYSEPEPIQLRLTSWAPSRGWSRQASQAGCLTAVRRGPPGGYHSRNPTPSHSEPQRGRGARHQLSDLPAQRAPYGDVDTHMHASADTHRSPLQTAGSGGLRCSISLPPIPLRFFLYLGSSCLHLSRQPLPSCRLSLTLTLLTPRCHSSSLVFSPPTLFIQPCQALTI